MMDRRLKLSGLRVQDVRRLIVEHPTSVGPTCPTDEVLRKMVADPRTRHLYVVDEAGGLLGSIRMNMIVDLLFPYVAMIEHGGDILHGRSVNTGAKTAGELMNPEPLRVLEETALDEVARVLMREKINELPVVDGDGRLIGEVNFFEIISAYLAEIPTEDIG